MKVNDVVVFKREASAPELTGVITRVDNLDYVQILAKNGKVYSSVYAGYLKPIGKTVDIEKILKEMESM